MSVANLGEVVRDRIHHPLPTIKTESATDLCRLRIWYSSVPRLRENGVTISPHKNRLRKYVESLMTHYPILFRFGRREH